MRRKDIFVVSFDIGIKNLASCGAHVTDDDKRVVWWNNAVLTNCRGSTCIRTALLRQLDCITYGDGGDWPGFPCTCWWKTSRPRPTG